MVNNFRVDVRSNFKEIALQYSDLAQKKIRAAAANALNRTATTVRAEAARAIRGQLGGKFTIGRIKGSISIFRADRNNLTATVRARGKRNIPIAALGARQTRSGVRVRVGRTTYSIPHAYLNPAGVAKIRAPSFKGQLVSAVQFRRRREPGWGFDYPVAMLLAPGIPSIFVQSEILNQLRQTAGQRFAVEFARQLRYRTGA